MTTKKTKTKKTKTKKTTKKTTIQARQGDVLVESVPTVPNGTPNPTPPENGRVVLAHGEVTGHAHAFYEPSVTELFQVTGATGTFLNLKESAPLKHEEHAEIIFPAGSYRVVRQKEYRPKAIPRNVAD